MKEQKITTQPYKGARDFYPEDMRVRNYIFDTWKKVCKRYGYEEYDFPILEPFEIFAAKTGEEIVNQQLFSFEDRGGRKLVVRPELTPGTVRMIAQKYNELPKPIRWFMIGNNWRFEKPQLGRGREFYQLEVNVFGIQSFFADVEIISIIIDLMKEFGAQETQFEVRISDRKLLNALLLDTLNLEPTLAEKTRRIMDKRGKIGSDAFSQMLADLGLKQAQIAKVEQFMSSGLSTLPEVIPQSVLEKCEGYQNVTSIFANLRQSEFAKYCVFDPSIIRGFDYSDGLVYEVFDKNPKNRRSLFGGERFDKLINIFGNFDLPATGFAMGDWTLLEFLKNWNLLPSFPTKVDFFLPLLPGDISYSAVNELAQTLRAKNKSVSVWLDTGSKLDKQLKYAASIGAKYAIILGKDEVLDGTVTIKTLSDFTQVTKPLEKFLSELE